MECERDTKQQESIEIISGAFKLTQMNAMFPKFMSTSNQLVLANYLDKHLVDWLDQIMFSKSKSDQRYKM